MPAGGEVLDVGCGMGEPISRHLLERGFRVVGIDASPSMIERGRARFPGSEWHVADMRELHLGRRFDGIISWGSFFHLSMDAQRAIFPRLAAHARPAAPLLFTSSPAQGEAIGSYYGEPLYHASLGPGEYERLLNLNGFEAESHVADDPSCGGHTVWLATCRSPHPAPDVVRT